MPVLLQDLGCVHAREISEEAEAFVRGRNVPVPAFDRPVKSTRENRLEVALRRLVAALKDEAIGLGDSEKSKAYDFAVKVLAEGGP